jgi:hypothetical protein
LRRRVGRRAATSSGSSGSVLQCNSGVLRTIL